MRTRTSLALLISVLIVSTNTAAAQFTFHKERKLDDMIKAPAKIAVLTTSDIPIGQSVTRSSGSGKDRMDIETTPRRMTSTLESLVAFDPNADALWPGALVQGNSMPSGILAPFVLPRKPITVTVTNLMTAAPDASLSAIVEKPSNAAVQDAIKKLVQQKLTPNQPARVSLDVHTFSSLRQAMLQVGASYEWLSGSVRTTFEAQQYEQNNNVVVKFVQTYYSASVNPPASPTSMFDIGAVNLTTARQYIGKPVSSNLTAGPPGYVSTVTYGRILYFFFSSTESSEQLQAAVRASFNAAVTSGAISIDAKLRQTLKSSDTRVLVLGGGGRAAAKVVVGGVTPEALRDFIAAGSDFGPKSPGAPISYQIRYLTDNDVARLSFTTDYTLHTDHPNPERIVTMKRTWFTDDDDKDRGNETTERVLQGNVELAYGRGGADVVWHDHTTQEGPMWALPANQQISLKTGCSGLTYNLAKTTDDGWRLHVVIEAWTDAGNKLVLAKTATFQLGNDAPHDTSIPLVC